MKSVSLISAIIGLSLAANAMGADDETVEASKRAAVDTCVSKAIEKYGSAEAVGKISSTRLNSKRGYKVRLKVGERSRKVNCFAAKNGEVTFYSGS